MANVNHSAITDPNIHEIKGAAAASANTVPVADGSGATSFSLLDFDNFNSTNVTSSIQSLIDSDDLELTGKYYLTAVITDVSTTGNILVPVIKSGTFTSARVVLGGAITTDDAEISFKTAAGLSMGTAVTVVQSGSAEGDAYTFTPSGNNVLVGPTYIEIETDGASDTARPLYITLEISGILN